MGTFATVPIRPLVASTLEEKVFGCLHAPRESLQL